MENRIRVMVFEPLREPHIEYIKNEKPNELVSLNSSMDVMELMDEIRRQIGVIFPCD